MASRTQSRLNRHRQHTDSANTDSANFVSSSLLRLAAFFCTVLSALSTLLCTLLCVLLCILIPRTPVLAQSEPTPVPVQQLRDGTLRDAALLSIDKAILVGDANTILVTDDAGKRWRSPSERSETNHYAIGFDTQPNPTGARSGLIVGGSVQPETGRSLCSVLISNDDGSTWTPTLTNGLPRFIGLQAIKHHHWIAWGDWSPYHNSSLFESIDGGITWSPRPVPCGHLQSATVSPEGKTLLIDRSGRAFFAQDGVDYQALDIDSDPFHPLRFCTLQAQGWWMGGDAGRLFHSIDGSNWHPVKLPLPPSELPCIDLTRMEGFGEKLWIVGNPGSILWTSEDHGATWVPKPTGCRVPLLGIKASNEQVLMAWGTLGNVLQSRNGGNAWKTSHASASRLLCLSISATEEAIPWDILSSITHETQHQCGAIVVHDRRFTEVLHQELDRLSALECLTPSIRANHITLFRAYPISNMPVGFKASDLAYYQSFSDEILRKLVLEIRAYQPDMIVTGDPSASDTLESAHAALVTRAIELAANVSYQPTPNLTVAPTPPWVVQRVLQRTDQKSGLSLSPSMLLKSSNRLLGQVLQDVRHYYAHRAYASNAQAPFALANKANYRLLVPKGASISHPTDGLVIRDESKLAQRIQNKTKLQLLMASANAQTSVAQLLQTRGSEVFRERAWDDALAETIKPLADDSALDVLWMVAQESRIQGNWHRWHTALQTISTRYPQERYQEMVLREWMTYMGSAEVQLVIDSQIASKNDALDNSDIANTLSGNVTSPFSQNNGVQLVTATTLPKRTPIAQGNAEREFGKMLGTWPESWNHKKSEPAWAWLIASRFRTSSWIRAGSLDPTAERSFWPNYYPSLGNWSGIFEQERVVQAPTDGSLPLPRIPWLPSRPHLDGIAEPEIWNNALAMPLSTAWAEDNQPSTLRIFRDHEFLFIHAEHPRFRSSEIVGDANKSKRPNRGNQTTIQNKRDSLDPNLDHARLRFDLDRDYATWFEFGWDIQGGISDQCNDMKFWNPQWFVATHHNNDTWNVELAIPIASLTQNAPIDWSSQAWAISLTRQRPSMSTEFLVAGDSDCWGLDQWLLVDPKAPTPPPQAVRAEPGVQR